MDILKKVDLIACEDTRQTIKLLNHSGIRKPLTSYHEFNEEEKAEDLAARLAKEENIALVCDAGTPAISDPGYRLVRLCRERGIPVIAIPGPNAAVAALSASGLPSGEFIFIGFLPAKKTARLEKLASIVNVPCTLVFYESPHRIETVLEDYACDSAKGVAAVKKLIYQDKVFMLHGNSCSAVAMAIKPVVVEAGIPWVIAHAANPAISSPPTKNIFHGVPVGKTMGIAMGQFVASKPGLTKVAVISHTDDWAKSYCVPANEYLASKNIKPVVEVAFERGQTDATAQTLRIKQANPDFVIACLYEAETAIFLKDAKKFGLNVPVMGTAGTDLENTLKRVGDLDTVSNYYVPHMYADNLDGPRLKPYADILKKYYPSESLTAFSLRRSSAAART